MSRASRNFSISLSPPVFKRVEREAGEANVTRSNFIEAMLMHGFTNNVKLFPSVPPEMRVAAAGQRKRRVRAINKGTA